jgi:hypothetical protein
MYHVRSTRCSAIFIMRCAYMHACALYTILYYAIVYCVIQDIGAVFSSIDNKGHPIGPQGDS